ncbi:TPM domain-containing protein [Pyxidicoccus sp. 3LFB2]
MVKSWSLVLLLPVFLLGATPSIDRPVVVDADIPLYMYDREVISSELVQLRKETGAQMAVLVVNTTEGEPIEDYALRVANEWKGGEAGKDNGLLLVLAVKDRRMRLEVGSGLEAHLPEDGVRTLLEAQAPLLREGKLPEATLAVVRGVRARVPTFEGVVKLQELWTPDAVGNAFMGTMFAGLVAGGLLGMCRVKWRTRLGTARLTGAVVALLAVPPAAIAFAVRSSHLPTWHFLLAHAVFCAVFFLLTLGSTRVGFVFSLLGAGAVLLGGWLGGADGLPADVMELLAMTAVWSVFPLFLVGIACLVVAKASGKLGSGHSSSRGSTSRSPARSSSSSSSSSKGSGSGPRWGGGGGRFGGGGGGSSW